jgi:Fe-S-cluster containining protein
LADLRKLRIETHCSSCVNKCCSEPYDWVFLTHEEIRRLEDVSGLASSEFVMVKTNPKTGDTFRYMPLPCKFLAPDGRCSVYESRPMVCKLFPFNPEVLTASDPALIPAQCGENLSYLPEGSNKGWGLSDYADDADRWMDTIWKEARPRRTDKPTPETDQNSKHSEAPA